MGAGQVVDAVARALAELGAEDFLARWRRLPAGQQADALLHRFRYDRATFLKWCFPRVFGRKWNRFHLDVLTRPKPSFRERAGRDVLRVDAAPRGIAKTTLLKGELIHDVCYGLEDNVVVVSAEMRLARKATKHLLSIFRNPPKAMRDLFGAFVVAGGVDNFTVTTADGHVTGFLARSFGTAVRGENEEGARPTKIVVDDGERSDRVRNPEQRRVWWEFLHNDILRCGPIEGGLLVEWRGTILHPDAILPNLLKAAGWRGSTYKACEAWPARMDLWGQAGKLFADLTLGDVDARSAAAAEFYAANKAEMDAGAVMLDPEAMPVFRFFEQIWTFGMRQVLQELQNEPRTAGTKFFATEQWAYCDVVGDKASGGHLVRPDGRKVKLADLRAFARLDPIPGKALGTMGDEGGAGAGDYAAIAVIGVDTYGYVYVLDCWMQRARDGEQLAMLWTLFDRWLFERATIETNGFARLLGVEYRRQQEERRAKGQNWQMVASDDPSTISKEDDIASIEASAASGQILWSRSLPPPVIGQFDSFPDGDHDDGADAIARCIRRSQTAKIGMVQTPVGAARMGLLPFGPR